MSDFEQWALTKGGYTSDDLVKIKGHPELEDVDYEYVRSARDAFNGAIASMQGEVKLSDRFIGEVIQNVAELPDRNSPDDWPEAMLVTSEELKAILLAVHEDVPAVTHAPESAARIAEQDARIKELEQQLGALRSAACEAVNAMSRHKTDINAVKSLLLAAIRQIGGAE